MMGSSRASGSTLQHPPFFLSAVATSPLNPKIPTRSKKHTQITHSLTHPSHSINTLFWASLMRCLALFASQFRTLLHFHLSLTHSSPHADLRPSNFLNLHIPRQNLARLISYQPSMPNTGYQGTHFISIPISPLSYFQLAGSTLPRSQFDLHLSALCLG